MKSKAQQIIDFHTEIQIILIREYKKRGLTSVDKINELTAKSKLEDALWKIPEAGQKGKPRFISQGVKNIRDILDSQGFKKHKKSIWTKKDISELINQTNVRTPSHSPKYYKYQFEHVVEKQVLIKLLLKASDENDIRRIISKYNIGCQVLPDEHEKLPDNLFEANDPWKRYKQAKIKVWDTKENKYVF
jgi:hypothetical protein